MPQRHGRGNKEVLGSRGEMPDNVAMNWNQLFAKRTGLMRRSAIRELLKVTSRPEVISFAGGLPAAELFPVDRVEAAVKKVFERVGPKSLQYGETEGVAELRDWIATRLGKAEDGRSPVQRENVLITTGAQQSLDLIGRVFLDEGDRVVVENPTYLALLSAWRPLGVEFLAVPSDAQGMRVEDLESLLPRRPKLIYLTPNFQNPQGTTLTLDRRKQLIAFARQHGVVVVEDNPYGELRYEGRSLPHLLELENESRESTGTDNWVIHVGSVSKVLMPGLRVGWTIAPREVIDKMVQAKQSADLQTSTFCQQVALELVRSGFLEEFVPQLRKCYGERRDAMLGALEKCMSGVAQWTRPEGGMFLLLALDQHLNAAELLPKAVEQNVAYVPGEEFHLDGGGKHTLRLNFSNARPELIEAGIGRLADVVKRELVVK